MGAAARILRGGETCSFDRCRRNGHSLQPIPPSLANRNGESEVPGFYLDQNGLPPLNHALLKQPIVEARCR
jgi:hypothetical protein